MWIRPMLKSDIKGIYNIEKSCFTDAWSIQTITDMYGAVYDKVAIAEDNNELIAYIDWRQNEFEAELLRIAVLKEYRGRGVSKRLMEYMLTAVGEACKDKKVFLEVRKNNNIARELYNKYGFEEIGIRKAYYSNPTDDAILMSLDLDLKGLVYKC